MHILNMKLSKALFSLLVLTLIVLQGHSQTIVPLYENTIALRVFDEGFKKSIEYQEVSNIEVGNELITYFDTRENFCVYSNGKKTDLLPAVNQFKTSETAVVFNSGPITFMYKDDKKVVLTNFGAQFDVSDSLVVYVNTFDGAVYCRYNDESVEMYRFITNVGKLGVLGENTFVFQNVAGDWLVFHKGKFTNLVNTQFSIPVKAGLDMVAFNDPFTNTFAAYDDGQMVDIEDFHAKRYEVGHNFIAYEDINGNLKVYQDGKTEVICSFPDFFEVKDSLVVYGEADMLKVHYKGESTMLENFIPAQRVMKNGILAYKNQMGGITAFMSGEKVQITNEQAGEFAINGQSVYYMNQNQRAVAYWKGKLYY